MAPVVGIVLVSHSERLAFGLLDLLRQLVGQRVPVFVAAGTEDGGIGTSDQLIRDAIARAQHGAGVVVLADLGSAVLTVLTVLEDTPATTGPGAAPGAVLVDAPIVEGAVAAAVTAGTGADLPAVIAAAEQARQFRKLPDPPPVRAGG